MKRLVLRLIRMIVTRTVVRSWQAYCERERRLRDAERHDADDIRPAQIIRNSLPD